MGRKITAVMILLLMTGCGSFEFYIKKNSVIVKIPKILIGDFELRNMIYDPYVAAEYREALKYEFFKRGINICLLPENEDSFKNDTDKTSAIAVKYAGDILIRGIICQRESGFLTSRKVNSSITFMVYSGNGKQIGEGFFYIEDPASDESVKRTAAEKFVSEFLEQTRSH